MKDFLYKNIILYSSHQWCGNTKEYFIKHTEKLVVFLLMPRVKNKDNLLRVYGKGRLVKEESITLSENIFLYYLLWYIEYLRVIFKFFSRKDKIIVISAHPYPFFGGIFQKLFRNITFVFWIADYFPPISLALRLFEAVKKFYHDGIPYACYLGDGVNKQMNGKVLNTSSRQTIMWGVNPKNIKRDFAKAAYNILYVGVIRHSVGLEAVYEFLKSYKQYHLKIVGICDNNTFNEHAKKIKQYGIEDRVYFPNRFFFDNELNEFSKKCVVGVALYTIDKFNTIYYSDPGKVKAYAEMGLPIIISKTSSISSYIKKFKAGEVIDRDAKSLYIAIKKIKDNYQKYLDGVEKFNKHFYYEKYYAKKFAFLESI